MALAAGAAIVLGAAAPAMANSTAGLNAAAAFLEGLNAAQQRDEEMALRRAQVQAQINAANALAEALRAQAAAQAEAANRARCMSWAAVVNDRRYDTNTRSQALQIVRNCGY
jgi:hypothetical protein